MEPVTIEQARLTLRRMAAYILDEFDDIERKSRASVLDTDVDSLKCLPMP